MSRLSGIHSGSVPSGSVMGGAIISADERYRYVLTRWWDDFAPIDLWIMCNPSTANSDVNDSTIRRCIGFSKSFGSGGLTVINAYAYRATKPAAMWTAQAAGVDIVGPENDRWLTTQLTRVSGRVIVAWGTHPKLARVREVDRLIRLVGRESLGLGVTKDGSPRHPLMVSAATELRPWITP